MTDQKPRQAAGLRRFRGPWRVEVAEASMLPAIAPGDWLLVDPTTRHWPRRGSVVVVREPDSGDLAIKRVAAGPGDRVPFADGYLILAEDEAWLLADADEETTRAAGFGEPIDSRRHPPPLRPTSIRPVPLDCSSDGRGSATGRCRRLGPIREAEASGGMWPNIRPGLSVRASALDEAELAAKYQRGCISGHHLGRFQRRRSLGLLTFIHRG